MFNQSCWTYTCVTGKIQSVCNTLSGKSILNRTQCLPSSCTDFSFWIHELIFYYYGHLIILKNWLFSEACGGTVGWGTALQAKRSRVWFLMVSLDFYWHNPSGHTMALELTQPHRNEYQEYFLGCKAGQCVGLTSPPSCADCFEIWKPQSPGTLRACPGL